MNQELCYLLDQYDSQEHLGNPKIEEAIWNRFGVKKVVLVIDMSGFSTTVEDKGIVFYLSTIRAMQKITTQHISESTGSLTKYDADNGFFVFPDVDSAFEFTLKVYKSMQKYNEEKSRNIKLCCGIDIGEILLINDSDFYGNPINIACKLGEDIANANEIILTENAYLELNDKFKDDEEEVKHQISNITIKSYHMKPKYL